MKKILLLLVLPLLLFAGRVAEYPIDWKSFEKVDTELNKIGVLPNCKADISKYTPIIRDTIKTYCGVHENGPGRVEILVNNVTEFSNKNAEYSEDTKFILHLIDMKLLFVTSYEHGKINYGVYTEEGKMVKGKRKSGLNPRDCKSCHNLYKDYCYYGQCGTFKPLY
jgi:hypothetical protein